MRKMKQKLIYAMYYTLIHVQCLAFDSPRIQDHLRWFSIGSTFSPWLLGNTKGSRRAMELFKDRPAGCGTESLSMMLPLGNKIPFCGGGE